MYIKKILWIVAILGLVVMGWFSYRIYDALFTPNTRFSEEQVYVHIPTGADFSQVYEQISPLLEDPESFAAVARQKKYSVNIKPGRYAIERGMNNNTLVNVLRSRNAPLMVSFNNQETLPELAGRIAAQIEADSLELLAAFRDTEFLEAQNLDLRNAIVLYLPNSYEFFWNTSAEEFRDRMKREYERFWTEERVKQAESQGLTPTEATTLASIVHKETAKVDERPRVAGVYLNRLRRNMLLQADPTVIYAIKEQTGDHDTIIKRVLYKDLALDSPYNTYKYAGLPPGPIAMPDISAIKAVLQPEKHDYLYFVADVENFGYHKFAKTLSQHNRNKAQYVRWINEQNIKR
ncbi:endolytic transglycosylase MltG [Zeaxanthinibacter enoshimensis]|uniref:Endolytic murein transglycosylase n=1 Tax=Zeaxanthinibacter enoshimensis TaxID=392009 RepID=A0A4R6TQH6_9FLAO|nr:endolytic transglycosylase MltG [Zeaxanthinibacter enoshimensis]TDQ31651.1 UPF0755 protein [Zeaxanthinibacter enoshimensis]